MGHIVQSLCTAAAAVDKVILAAAGAACAKALRQTCNSSSSNVYLHACSCVTCTQAVCTHSPYLCSPLLSHTLPLLRVRPRHTAAEVEALLAQERIKLQEEFDRQQAAGGAVDARWAISKDRSARHPLLARLACVFLRVFVCMCVRVRARALRACVCVYVCARV